MYYNMLSTCNIYTYMPEFPLPMGGVEGSWNGAEGRRHALALHCLWFFGPPLPRGRYLEASHSAAGTAASGRCRSGQCPVLWRRLGSLDKVLAGSEGF